jgi:aspartyl-tRNA(Asn)/glutamyl-tRNA(Gln) amidotransferase subunit B
MEKGSLRCDANVSVRPLGQKEFGVKVEIKNMNSFKNVQKAIDYEIKRQINEIERGNLIIQETRLWDPENSVTVSMRTKEESHDYRYFPDPDLVPVVISSDDVDKIRSNMPDLPNVVRKRLSEQYGLPVYDVEMLSSSKPLVDFFEATVKCHNNPKSVSNWIQTEILRVMNEKSVAIAEIGITPPQLGELIKLIDDGVISVKIAKEVFDNVIATGKNPGKIVEEKGLVQIADASELEAVVKKVLDSFPKEVERYKNGETKLTGFFVGQIMKETKGKANPKVVNELLAKLLG